MKKLAFALLAAMSANTFAQAPAAGAAVGGSFAAGTTVTTLVVAGLLPLVALVAVTAAAEGGNDTPTAPSTTPVRTN